MRRAFRGRALAAAAIGLAVIAGGERADAQRLTGTIRDVQSGQPVAGAIISLVGASGTTLAETLSDGAGVYRIPVDSGARRVLVRRIGFVLQSLPVPSAATTATATLDVNLNRIPTVLEPVISSASCRPAPGEGQALALWEQARTGFLAAVVARKALPARVKLARFRRQLRLSEIVRQEVALVELTTDRPFFAALAPEQLITRGVVSQHPAGGRVFHGLDPDLLLTEAFRSTHCFDLAPADPARRGQIGIAFVPARGRVRFPEVSGTIWLDSAPLALRSLEFEYENVSPADQSLGAGGRLSFHTADNGAVIVDHWELRILSPVSDVIEGPPLTMMPFTQVDGGTVITATWPDGSTFDRPMPWIDGRVVDRSTRAPLPGMIIWSMSRSYQSVSSTDGRFRIADLYPGPHTFFAIDTLWEPYGLGRATRAELIIGDSAARRDVTIEMPSVPETIRARCARTPVGRGDVLLAGRLVDTEGVLRKATIQMELSAWIPEGRGLVTLATTEEGYFSACGLLPGASFNIVALEDNGRRTVEPVRLGTDTIATVTITVPR